jgi:hypothetical protein
LAGPPSAGAGTALFGTPKKIYPPPPMFKEVCGIKGWFIVAIALLKSEPGFISTLDQQLSAVRYQLSA